MDARTLTRRRALSALGLIALGACVLLWARSVGPGGTRIEPGSLPLSQGFFEEFPPVDGRPAFRLFVVESERDLGTVNGFIGRAAPLDSVAFQRDLMIAFVGWKDGRAMLIDAVFEENGRGIVELVPGPRSVEAGQGEMSLPIHAVLLSRDAFDGGRVPEQWEARWAGDIVAGSRRFETGWFPSPLVRPDGTPIYDTLRAGIADVEPEVCLHAFVATEPGDLSDLDLVAGTIPPLSASLDIDFSREIVMAVRASTILAKSHPYIGHIGPTAIGGTVNLWWAEAGFDNESCHYQVVAIPRSYVEGSDAHTWSFMMPTQTILTLP